MVLQARIVVSLGNAEVVTGKGTRGLLGGFFYLDADYTTYLLCENSSSYYFDLCAFMYVIFKYVCYT